MSLFRTCMFPFVLIHKSPRISSIRISIATVVTHLSATAWSGFQIYFTTAFHNDFQRLTTDGACQINLLPQYWTSRARAEIPSLAFNVAALLVSCFLSFRLIKVKLHQTRF